MTLLRSLAIISASLLILNGCGGKKEQAPEQTARTTTESTAEDLFDEFYDSSETVEEEGYAEEEVVEEVRKEVKETSDIPAPAFVPDGRYVVQVSCVASEEIAEDVARKLENSGYPVYVAEVQNPTPVLLGTYYRIRIGGFNNLTDARNFGENYLLPSGFDFWLDNRSNDNVGIGDFGLGDAASFETEPVSEPAQDVFVEEPVSSTPVEQAQTVVEEVVETATETIEEVAQPAADVVEEVTETTTSTANDEWGTSEW